MISSYQPQTIEKRVLQRISSLKKGFRQNISILGAEGVGKTYLLELIYEQLIRDHDLIPVYVPCQGIDFSDLAERWIAGILSGLLPGNETYLQPVSTHLSSLESNLPKTVEKIRNLRKMIRRGEKCTTAIKELFGLSGVLAQEAGKHVVLLLDEFQALGELPLQDVYGHLGRQIMLEKNTLYVAVSSSPSRALEIFKSQLSLLFGNFETMHMSPLDAAETVRFIESALPGHLLSEAQKKFLIRLTGGMPLYLDLLLKPIADSVSVIRMGPEAPAVPLQDQELFHVFDREVFQVHGRLSQIFERRLIQSLGGLRQGAVFYHALIAVSQGARKVAAISAHMERKSTECKKILQRLVQEELLTKHNDFYLIEDALFSYWLSEVFSARCRQVRPFKDHRGSFLLSLQEGLESAAHEGPETIVRQVESLLRAFRNEALQLGHKRYRLPHFDQVSIRSAGGNRSWIFSAIGAAVEWQGRVACDLVHEEDVLLQKEEMRKSTKTVRTQLLIALGGIDQNAKLMTHESGIQLWQLDDLNRLFLLFNLPPLMGMRRFDGSTLGALAQSLHPA